MQGGVDSLRFSLKWWQKLDWVQAEPMLAVQDGMTPADIPGLECGIFVGGSTEWKLQTMRTWTQFAHQNGQICHIGRVNTRKRMQLCSDIGADSFDGSGGARFHSHAEKMIQWLEEINEDRQRCGRLPFRRC